ncbi:hypothetical protein JCGZ_12941 [Jatropha curcas]|uniref:Uncharacterized protein n=1 Tax=Jatropha curcas TaxID=180498 RepID=A0A067LGH9_JATCU|nr:hypothetical protein JCGZ_12941 [Jatropha curcas]
MGLGSQSTGIALDSHCTSTFNGVFTEPSQTLIFVEGKVFASRLRAIRAQSPHSQQSETMESRLRSKSMTVGGDDLDSHRWRYDRSEGRLEPCPASPKEPIATSILLNSGRKREGEGGGGAVVREEEEEGGRKKRERKDGSRELSRFTVPI